MRSPFAWLRADGPNGHFPPKSMAARSEQTRVKAFGLLGAGILFVASLSGCGPTATPSETSIPSIVDAEGLLARLVTLAHQGDFNGLCALGDLNCNQALDTAGRNNVPLDSPTVFGARVVPTTTSGGQTSMGGMVLELCGTTRSGSPYSSEMLVFRDAGGLRAINPVYWGATKIGSGLGTPASPAPSGHC